MWLMFGGPQWAAIAPAAYVAHKLVLRLTFYSSQLVVFDYVRRL